MSKSPGSITVRHALALVSWTAGVMVLAAAALSRDAQWLTGPAVALLLAGLIESEF